MARDQFTAAFAQSNFQNYSEEYGPPYLPVETAEFDPHLLRIHDTVTVVLLIDGAVVTTARTVSPGEDAATIMAAIAENLDTNVPDIHAFSVLNKIGVQALPGHTAEVQRVSVTPYTAAPVATVSAAYPAEATTETDLVARLVVNDAPFVFTVPTVGALPQDLIALADTINDSIWLRVQVFPDRLQFATHSGSNLIVVSVAYE